MPQDGKDAMNLLNRIKGMKLNTKFTSVIILMTAIPIGILAGVLFSNMEKSTVKEHQNYMQYKRTQSSEKIRSVNDSMNMSTQFFLSDYDMNQYLKLAAQGRSLSTAELIEFQESDVKNLERLFQNNPLLYLVRIYSTASAVQEMTPVLNNAERIEKLEWGKDGLSEIEGWHFGYYDTASSSLSTSQNIELLCYVTPIEDYRLGVIGYVETAARMEEMFPCLYEGNDSEFSCYIDVDGNYHFGNQTAEEYQEIVADIYENYEPDASEVFYRNKKGANLLITILPIEKVGGCLIQVEDITKEVRVVYQQRNIFIGVVVLILIALSFIINWIVKSMLRQLYIIIKQMNRVEGGDLSARIERESFDEMGALGSQLNRMLDRIEELMKESVDRELLVKNSEIRALQNQINAHFIYNVLETIKMMAEIDEEYEISDAITALGKLLRYSMKWVSGNVSLKDELEYIKSYLVLMNLRYDFTIYLSLNLNESMMQQELPKMSLQPIVENAVLHGIEPMAEDATIYIKGWYEGDDCIIEITDAGSGMSDEQYEKLNLRMQGAVEPTGGDSKSNGIGLKNVHDRIQMAFGKNYGLSFSTKLGCYTKVAVKLPRKESKIQSASDVEAIRKAAQMEE